jgi:hypothetical protein
MNGAVFASTVPAPGPMVIAPYARSIYSHFRWASILIGLLHVFMLISFANKRVTGIVAALFTVAYAFLFLNLIVLSRVGWRLFSARMKTVAFVMLVLGLMSMVLWMLTDTSDALPSVLAYGSAFFAAIAWVGVLGLLQGIVSNADGQIEDSFRRGAAAISSGPPVVLQGEEPSPTITVRVAPPLAQVIDKIPGVLGGIASSAPAAAAPTQVSPAVHGPQVSPVIHTMPPVQQPVPPPSVPGAVANFFQTWFGDRNSGSGSGNVMGNTGNTTPPR